MYQEPSIDYSATCDAMKRVIDECDFKVKLSTQNKKLLQEYNDKLAEQQRVSATLAQLKLYIAPLITDIQNYTAQRKRDSMQKVNNAIRIANEIIPDAMANIKFEVNQNEAWLQTDEGLLVRMSEGNGYKSILSAFLRGITVKANSKNIPIMILDEMFSRVSVEYSATLSAFLSLIMQDMQIISIEQKPEVYANLDYTQYNFLKQGNYTTVTKEEIHNVGVDTNENMELEESVGDGVPVPNNDEGSELSDSNGAVSG